MPKSIFLIICLVHQYVLQDNDLQWLYDVGLFPKHSYVEYGVISKIYLFICICICICICIFI